MSYFIAEKKKEENIAEYILYMWQMEDLIRASGMNMEHLEETVIQQFQGGEEEMEKEREWFKSLIQQMKNEGVEEKGHLEIVNEVVVELYYLHNTLLNVMRDEKYTRVFEAAMPHISQLQEKSQGRMKNEIETCLNGLYGLLVLRLKNEPVSEETQASMETFRKVLAYLAQQYKKMKAGELNFHMN